MSDTPETFAAILAEFRKFALRAAEEDKMISPESVLLLADRIEAAVERERAAHTNDIHDALYLATGIPGNAAAMREALERIVQICHDLEPLFTPHAIQQHAEAALAAPARNCDRFATAEEAVAAFADHLRAWENAHGICSEYPDHAVRVPAGAFAWLFAPAEGGSHA